MRAARARWPWRARGPRTAAGPPRNVREAHCETLRASGRDAGSSSRHPRTAGTAAGAAAWKDVRSAAPDQQPRESDPRTRDMKL